MMFSKSALALSALLALSSALTVERNGLSPSLGPVSTKSSTVFSVTGSSCEKEDESDCKEFCGMSEQTATCSANGNKVTCSCKGGKSESNCEERCLLCMPDKSALEEASRLFKLGGSKMEL
ncbi:uncharacterized protein RCO7_10288 [Rhynchosporium graminicola]|uniref:EGF-like domain-containing protein n=1 Tax=Rhynchosporium graminicola TaxID=2792576 RepID=A0A1E1LB14_9HELO|nr:uncharacterized protein RCO7_10288 [Rhynchosporium commune]